MNTKKDFIAIARILKDNTEYMIEYKNYPFYFKNNLIRELSRYFRETNPLFDYDKFIQACKTDKETL